jgi:hypothetical protein
VNTRKLFSGALFALLAYYTVTHPGDAAANVRTVLTGIGQFAAALTGGGR